MGYRWLMPTDFSRPATADITFGLRLHSIEQTVSGVVSPAGMSLPTLGGSVELKIKPGTQSGQKMRLKGKGMPGSPPGDQFVEIRIHTPPADGY